MARTSRVMKAELGGMAGEEAVEIDLFENPDRDGHDDERCFRAYFRDQFIGEGPAPRATSITFNQALHLFASDMLLKAADIYLLSVETAMDISRREIR